MSDAMHRQQVLPDYRPRAAARDGQRGIYALEWAYIFPALFALLYACLSYGLVFLVSESMQLAVEDGARATLRYQPTRTDRLSTARSLIQERMGWLPDALRPVAADIHVNICRLQDLTQCSASMSCGTPIQERCMVQVSFSIPYAANPMVPSFGLPVPATLTAQASILVDKGGL